MKKLIIILFIAIGFINLGCDSLVEGLNNNPNLPTEAPSDNILTGAEVALIQVTEGNIARVCGMWAGYFKGEARQYEGFYNYLATAGDFSAGWEDIYSNVVRNAKVTRQVADSEGNIGIVTGITNVLYAIGIGTSTSLWGNVPFVEAGDYENFPTPAYEEQLDVYTGLQGLLDQAILELSSGTGRPGVGSDIFFNGDPDSWIQVANTLKARYYMQTGEYSNAYNAALQGISNSSNSMLAQHQNIVGTQNLYFQFFASNRADDLSSSGTQIVNLLDPASTDFRGNSKTDEATRFSYLLITAGDAAVPNSGGIFSETNSFPIVSYEENILTLAEAGARSEGFTIGLGHLNEFRAFMSTGGYISNNPEQYDAYVAADFDNGGIENVDGITNDNALLREVLEERYITFFGQIGGFNDVLRTLSEPTVRVQVEPNSGASFPQRFLYPQTEVDRNPNTPNPIPGIFDATPINQ